VCTMGSFVPAKFLAHASSTLMMSSSHGPVDRWAALIAIYSTAVWEMKWALSNFAQPRNISRGSCKLLQLWHSLCEGPATPAYVFLGRRHQFEYWDLE